MRRCGVYLGPALALLVIVAGWCAPQLVSRGSDISSPDAASRLRAAAGTQTELGPLFARVVTYEVGPDGVHPSAGRVEWRTLFGLPAGSTVVPGRTEVRAEMIALGWALLVVLEVGAAAWFVLGLTADDL